MIQPNAFLISKKIANIIGPWDTNLSPTTDEDSEYFCRAILKSNGIIFTPKGINFYRNNLNLVSLSRTHDSERVYNALKVINKKAKHLLEYENSRKVKIVLAIQYSIFIYLYIDYYPEQVKMAKQKIIDLGFNSIPISGGNKFKKLAKIIGMENAFWMRKTIKKYFK